MKALNTIITSLSLLLTVWISTPASASVQSASELVALGDSAYVDKEYFKAIELYDSAMVVGGPSATVYYNMGNAYYRIGQPGYAILSYERALRINPAYKAARLNLAFVDSQTADKTTDSGNVMIQMTDSITAWMTANAWAYTTLALFVLFILLAAGYIFFTPVLLRKVCFFGGMVVLVLTVAGVGFSIHAANVIDDDTDAIVVVKKAHLSLTPGRASAEQGDELVIHEGHKVQILDSVSGAPGSNQGKWYEISVGNNTKAWIQSDDVERVSDAVL